MPNYISQHWHFVLGFFALILAVLSLGYDVTPQFPSMCVILGIILAILIDTLEPIPAVKRHDWNRLYTDMKSGKVDIGRSLLFFHAKLIFPTLFTIYLILLILQKVKVVPTEWKSYASAAIDTLYLLWVTLFSAVLTNFTGLRDDAYEVEHTGVWANIFTILLICLLAYGGMWAIFVEIAVIGRVAYFVALSVGILIALVSFMILTEPEEESQEESRSKLSSVG